MFVNMARAHGIVEQGEGTARRLVAEARALFRARRYKEVSAEAIVAAAGVTRGALYHHFNGKKGLFEAVFVSCERDIAAQIAAAARDKQTPEEQLLAGSLAFLAACADPALRGIVIVDAPTVLGWSRWREIDAQHGLALLRESIYGLQKHGQLREYATETLVYMLSGAMNELAMWVAESDDAATRLKSAQRNLTSLLNALLKTPTH